MRLTRSRRRANSSGSGVQIFPHSPCCIYKEGTSNRLSPLSASDRLIHTDLYYYTIDDDVFFVLKHKISNTAAALWFPVNTSKRCFSI